jgi:hypothetical protein
MGTLPHRPGGSMKCKVGDLALVVKAAVVSNHGILVEVLRQDSPGRWWVRSLCGPRMATDGKRRLEVVALDASLRPIRKANKVRRKTYAPNAQASLI